jgi:peptidoglycan/xylan/chitin deacetylase (PgdA/CDA1 family)
MDIQARRLRREERRRALRRRRRMTAGAALAIVALAVVCVAVLARGGSPSANRRDATSGTRKAAGSPHRSGTTTAASASAPLGKPGDEAVPILMYHVIAAPPTGAPFPGLYVTPAEFAEQMQSLQSAGWHAVTLDELQANWRRGAGLGAGKPVVLTFDNGYQSQYTQALPVLRRLGWVADENMQLAGLPPSQGGLGEEEIRGLVAAGWELDTQGFTHADLIKLDAEALRHEVADSRTEIQRRYHVPVNWFCYPSGHYDATVVAAVKAAGYTGSTTVIPGWARREEDPYRMHRLRVLGGTSGSQLLADMAAVRGDAPAPSSYSG